MPRPLEPTVPPDEETRDRVLVLSRKGDLRLEDFGRMVGRSKSFVSRWLKHQAELRDDEIDRWVEATGISRRTFLDGRFESRNRFGASAADAAA